MADSSRSKKVIIEKLTAALFASLLLFFALTSPLSMPSSADTPAVPETVKRAQNIFLYNTDSETVLYSKNPDERIRPSASSRIMSALVTLEKLGNRLDNVIVMRKDVVSKARLSNANRLGLEIGEYVSIRTLYYGMLMYGAVDATIALAVEAYGSSANCTARMNEKASELGMKNTHYMNATGQEEEGQYSTVSDMVKLAVEASQNETYMLFASETYRIISRVNYDDKFTIYTQNYLLSRRTLTDYYDSYVTGLAAAGIDHVNKELSGFCVVASASIENVNYICVVADADTVKDDGSAWFYSFSVVSDLLDWVNKNYGFRDVLDSATILGEIGVNLASGADYVSVIPSEKLVLFLPKNVPLDELLQIKTQLDFDRMTAPVEEGTVVGSAVITMDGEVICQTTLVTKNSLSLSKWQYFRSEVNELMQHKAFTWIIVGIVASAVIFILIKARLIYLRNHRIKIHIDE